MSEKQWMILNSFFNKDIIDPTKIHQEHKKRSIRTKYDYISIHIHIDKYEYVFSRFNLSRYLRACQIPPNIAVDISRRIKEILVDEGILEITQEEFEKRVIGLMSFYDSSSLFKRRFKLIQRFNFERVPLIIFISGTGFTGKSSLAFQLGERLNISTILQTGIIKSLSNGIDDHLNMSLWDNPQDESFFEQYEKECDIVQKGIEGDIYKTITDGKPLIIEGIHLNPSRFLTQCGGNSILPLDCFKLPTMNRIAEGKQGFILPILVKDSSNSIYQQILNFWRIQNRNMEILSIQKLFTYVLELQDYLESMFPSSFVIDVSTTNPTDRIHSIFLDKLEQCYGDQSEIY